MTKEEVVARIATEIIKIDEGINIKDVTPGKFLTFDLGLDSLDVAELVVKMEATCDVKIPDEEMDRIHTVGNLADSICRQMEKKNK